jgi:uncharacterized membrane protein
MPRPSHPSWFDLLILITFGEKHKLWTLALCNFLQSSLTSWLLNPNIFLSPLFLTPLTWETKFHTHTKQDVKFCLVHVFCYVLQNILSFIEIRKAVRVYHFLNILRHRVFLYSFEFLFCLSLKLSRVLCTKYIKWTHNVDVVSVHLSYFISETAERILMGFGLGRGCLHKRISNEFNSSFCQL